MDKIPETPLPIKLKAHPVPPKELPDELQELLKVIAPATNLEERLENWGSD